MSTGQRTITAPDSYRLILPSGWFTLSTDPARRDADVKRMLDRQFTGRARDELISLRVELDRRLRRDLSRAAEAGATCGGNASAIGSYLALALSSRARMSAAASGKLRATL